MAQNVTIAGASYSDVPAIVVPKTGGGSAQFDDTTIASNAAAAGDILSGKKAYVNGDEITGNIVTKTSSDLSASGDTVTVPAGYYASQATKSVSHGDVRYPQYITVDNPIMSPPGTSTLTFSKTIEVAPEIVTPGYISTAPARDTTFKLETNIGIKGPETYTPTTSAQTIARGQYLMGAQTIAGDANLTAGNIKKDVAIFGVTGTFEGGGGGTDVSDTTATAGDVLSGKKFHIADGSYVSGTIPTKTSSDVTVSGKTVSIPAGYYATAVSESVADGSATTPATTISVSPSLAVDSSTGVVTASVSGSQSVTPTVSEGYVSTGTAGTVSVSGSNTLSLSTAQGGTITPTESQQTAVASGKYTLGAVTVAGDANLAAGNIKDGTSIFGVTGTFTDASTVSSGQTAATASEILTGYSAWVDGVEVQGTASGGGVSASDAILTVTVPSDSTVTMTKGNITLLPTIWTTAIDGDLECALFIIGSSMFDSNEWTVTASKDGDNATNTIVINANLQYAMEMDYCLYIIENGMFSEGFSRLKVGYSGATVTEDYNGAVRLLSGAANSSRATLYFMTTEGEKISFAGDYSYLCCEHQARGTTNSYMGSYGVIASFTSNNPNFVNNSYYYQVSQGGNTLTQKATTYIDISSLTGDYWIGFCEGGTTSATGEFLCYNLWLSNTIPT